VSPARASKSTGESANVLRAESILLDYADLLREGYTFQNGDLKSYLRVVLSDPEGNTRSLPRAADNARSVRKRWRRRR
jgi:hypothetical protein